MPAGQRPSRRVEHGDHQLIGARARTEPRLERQPLGRLHHDLEVIDILLVLDQDRLRERGIALLARRQSPVAVGEAVDHEPALEIGCGGMCRQQSTAGGAAVVERNGDAGERLLVE